MAAPIQIDITVNTWTLVAEDVTGGLIKIKDPIVSNYFCTFVETGDSAPTGDHTIEEAWQLRDVEQKISAQAGVDVYLYCINKPGKVLVIL